MLTDRIIVFQLQHSSHTADGLQRNAVDIPLVCNTRIHDESNDLHRVSVILCHIKILLVVPELDIGIVDHQAIESPTQVLSFPVAILVCFHEFGGIELVLTRLRVSEEIIRRATDNVIRKMILDPGGLTRTRNPTHDDHPLHTDRLDLFMAGTSRGISWSPC